MPKIKMLKISPKSLALSALLTVTLLLLFTLTGCGGSSGSSSTMSPEELEIATVIDAFAAAVTAEDEAQAKTFIYSNLDYYGGINDSQILNYTDFITRMSNFFTLASNVKCEITGLGITLSGETLASARAQLFLDYTSTGEQKLFETIELKLEKEGKNWGIVEFAQYGSSGTAATQFPPQS